MTTLTCAAFAQWLHSYGQASIHNDPQASAELFAGNARYYESPFAQPLAGRQAIYDYWAAGAQNLADKEASYEILSVRDQVGIARWRARFLVKATGAAVALDCIFVAEFDDQGLCCCFREWWHSRPDPDPAGLRDI